MLELHRQNETYHEDEPRPRARPYRPLCAVGKQDLGMTSEERFARIEANLDRVAELLAQDGENIRALARIAESHEQRLDDIEHGSKG